MMKKKFWKHTDSTKHKKLIEDFKKPIGTGKDMSDLSILIVTDMLLTGFDAPIAQVMYLDRKLTDHTLLQAIARVNRTNKNKFRGYIVDYYGISDYLTEALEMFSSSDIQGALVKLIDELPKLKNAHTRVLRHFEGLNLNDLDSCILSLNKDIKRKKFQTDFQIFSRQLDIILPDKAATPFLQDLRLLGKIAIGSRNLYRDEQLNISAAGEKVRELIEEHVYSIGINPKIPPIDLLAENYKEILNQHKSSHSMASEVENAIKYHIKINKDEDPEYYQNLSNQLEDIIIQHADKWDELVQLLLDFRDNIEVDHKKQAKDLGLTKTELAFYNILIAESICTKSTSKEKNELAIDVVKSIVDIFENSTKIVDFFKKWDEQRRVRRDIKRIIIENFDESLVEPITERFMELAKVKFS